MDKKRDETILKYKPYVKKIANNILRTLPPNLFEEDELINIGIIGLIYAYDNYDEKFNCSFITYASYRIRGSILSELRKRDFVGRTTRKKIKDYEKLILTLERKLFRKPTYEELANFMNINIEKIYNIHKLKEITFTDYSNVENLILQNSYDQKYNENGIINKQQYDIIINIINKLNTREKEIIYKYYFYDMSMNEIGISYNITESRVSQIISNTIDKIRNKLKEYENGDLKIPITSSEEIDRINICNQDGCNNKIPFGYRFKHCPSCHSKKMKLAATRRYQNKQLIKSKKENIIEIDFSSDLDLLDQLVKISNKERRTVSNQILCILEEGLKRYILNGD